MFSWASKHQISFSSTFLHFSCILSLERIKPPWRRSPFQVLSYTAVSGITNGKELTSLKNNTTQNENQTTAHASRE